MALTRPEQQKAISFLESSLESIGWLILAVARTVAVHVFRPHVFHRSARSANSGFVPPLSLTLISVFAIVAAIRHYQPSDEFVTSVQSILRDLREQNPWTTGLRLLPAVGIAALVGWILSWITGISRRPFQPLVNLCMYAVAVMAILSSLALVLLSAVTLPSDTPVDTLLLQLDTVLLDTVLFDMLPYDMRSPLNTDVLVVQILCFVAVIPLLFAVREIAKSRIRFAVAAVVVCLLPVAMDLALFGEQVLEDAVFGDPYRKRRYKVLGEFLRLQDDHATLALSLRSFGADHELPLKRSDFRLGLGRPLSPDIDYQGGPDPFDKRLHASIERWSAGDADVWRFAAGSDGWLQVQIAGSDLYRRFTADAISERLILIVGLFGVPGSFLIECEPPGKLNDLRVYCNAHESYLTLRSLIRQHRVPKPPPSYGRGS